MLALKFKSEERLHISKGPGIKSWSILVGLLSLGLGAGFYGADWFIVKAVYVVGCLVIGLTCMDEWQDCVMDKLQNKATVTRANWYDKLCCRVPECNTMVLTLSSIIDVRVSAAKKKDQMSHTLTLVLNTGISFPVMEISDPVQSDLIYLSNQVSSFLKLNRIEPLEEKGYFFMDGDSEWADAASESSESGSEPETRPSEGRIRDIVKVIEGPIDDYYNVL